MCTSGFDRLETGIDGSGSHYRTGVTPSLARIAAGARESKKSRASPGFSVLRQPVR
jgi:hypothetical protein